MSFRVRCRVLGRIFFLLCVAITGRSEDLAGSINPTTCAEESLSSLHFLGRILLPGSKGYSNAIKISNRRVESFPALVIQPVSSYDVEAGLQTAQLCSLKFSVLNGGHSAAGYCLNQKGLVLDLSLLKSLQRIAPDQLVVQAGVTWENIYRYLYSTLNDSHLVAVGASVPSVGVSGFVLGGGFSYLSRMYGLGCDNVLSLTMVLANSTVVKVNSSENSDLRFALCGGGGGNFGVVTEFTLALHPHPWVLSGELCWPTNSSLIPELFNFFLENFDDFPNWLTLEPFWVPADWEKGNRFCYFIVCSNTQEICESPSFYVSQLISKFSPPVNVLKYQPFLKWNLEAVERKEWERPLMYEKSGFFLQGHFTDKVVAILQRAINLAPSKRSLILFTVGGGKIAERSNEKTAFPHRKAQFLINVEGLWEHSEEAEENIAWVKEIGKELKPYLGLPKRKRK